MRDGRNKVLGIAGALVLLLSGLQPALAGTAAPKPGTRCAPVARTVSVAGIRYRCVKDKGKIVWTKVKSPGKAANPTMPVKPVLPILRISPKAVPAKPAPVPGSRYAFLGTRSDGTPVRWSGCMPIRWTYYDEPAKPNGLDAVQRSLQLIADASGFTFEYVAPGGLSKPLWSVIGDANRDPLPAPLQIMFGDTSNIPTLIGDTLGETAVYWSDPDGEIQVAYVVIRPDQSYGKADFQSNGIGLVILHELLHAMGLAHVDSTADLMYPDLGAITTTTLAAGDLAGLYQVSAAHPCKG